MFSLFPVLAAGKGGNGVSKHSDAPSKQWIDKPDVIAVTHLDHVDHKQESIVTAACLVIALVGVSYAASFSDSLKSMMGSSDADEKIEEKVSDAASDQGGVTGSLTDMISSQLGVSKAQAEGGLGSLFEAAKSTLGGQDFSELGQYVPEMSTLLAAAPAIVESAGGLGGLTGSMGKYGSALEAGTKAYSQFDKLGLGADKIPQYVDVTKGFLSSKGGKYATDLFVQGVAGLL